MRTYQMVPEEREREILVLLENQRKVTISELVTSLNVSEVTIRRDLRRLAARHFIRRIRGGAIPVDTMELEPPVMKRTGLHAEEKQRIGAAAADLIDDGDTVTLLGGSTTLQLVQHLRNKENLTIITDSLLIAHCTVKQANTNLIVLGGAVEYSELSMGGNLALLCLRELHAHKVIFGVRAVNFNQGLMLARVSELALYRECMQAAHETILLVDHSKFGQVATAVLGPLTLVNRIVTSRMVPPQIPARLRDMGIEVILA